MKILDFKMYYEPENAAGIYLDSNTAEDLALRGHEVHVWAPTPTRGVTDEQRKNTPRIETRCDGNLIIHRYAMYREGNGLAERTLRYGFCCIKQIFIGLKTKNVDVLFVGSTPPFQGFVASWIKKIKRCKLVYNLQDISPDSMVSAGLMEENSFLWRICRRMEDRTYRRADQIITISEDCKANLLAKGVEASKIHVIGNWIDEAVVHPVERADNFLFREMNLDAEKFYVVYAGNLGYVQGIATVLEAARILEDEPNINFLIFGEGAQKEELIATARDEGLANINFYPLQPYVRVSEVYSIGDACIVACKKGSGSSAMPSKTWSIMACARPILASFDKGSALEQLVSDCSCGLFSEAENADALADNVRLLFHDKDRMRMGENGRMYVLDNLSRKECTEKIRVLIENA